MSNDNQLAIIHQHNKRLAKSSGYDLKFADSTMRTDNLRTVKQLLAAQWVDGPPKDTGKGLFMLRFEDYATGGPDGMFFNASTSSLVMTIDARGPIIKHMRLPDYD